MVGILHKAKFFIQIEESTIHNSHALLVCVRFIPKRDIREEMLVINILREVTNGGGICNEVIQ